MTGQRGFVASERRTDNQDEDVTTRVVSRVAAEEGVDPESLEPRLYDAIDPETLSELVEGASDHAALSIEFRYAGYQVSIDAGDRVEIDVLPA